jgi:hypothetical protein
VVPIFLIFPFGRTRDTIICVPFLSDVEVLIIFDFFSDCESIWKVIRELFSCTIGWSDPDIDIVDHERGDVAVDVREIGVKVSHHPPPLLFVVTAAVFTYATKVEAAHV